MEQKSINLYFGNDEFQKNKEINSFITDWQKLNPDGDIETIDGTCTKSEEILSLKKEIFEALQTTSMFGESKLIYVKNITFLGYDPDSKTIAAKETQEYFLEYFKKKSKLENTLLITGTDFDKRTSLYKFLYKNDLIKIFTVIDEKSDNWEFESKKIISQMAKEKNITFQDNDSLSLFANLIGTNTYLINQELEKISIYLGNKKSINQQTINDLVSRTRHGVIFSIGQAIAKKDLKNAFNFTQEIINLGESAISILNASIIPTIKSILHAKILITLNNNKKFSSYASLNTFINKLPDSQTIFLSKNKNNKISSYPIWLNQNYTENFTIKSLKQSLTNSLDTNHKLVSTDIDHALLLFQLISKILK